jgi:hypothetical protein
MNDTSYYRFRRLMRFRLNDMGNRKKLESENRTRKKILSEFLRSMKTKKLILIFFSFSLSVCLRMIVEKQSGVERS